MNTNYMYEAIFVFNKTVPTFIKNKIVDEFVRLREYAVDICNPKFEQWNAEYTGPEVREDDPLANFGGTDYCNYIRKKLQRICNFINWQLPSDIITLEVDEMAVFFGKTKIGGITVELRMKPLKTQD